MSLQPIHTIVAKQFPILDMASIKAKEAIQREEDAQVFKAIHKAGKVGTSAVWTDEEECLGQQLDPNTISVETLAMMDDAAKRLLRSVSCVMPLEEEVAEHTSSCWEQGALTMRALHDARRIVDGKKPIPKGTAWITNEEEA